jgi:hypothetical protein
VRVPQLRLCRRLRLVHRRSGQLSQAATRFLAIVKQQRTRES